MLLDQTAENKRVPPDSGLPARFFHFTDDKAGTIQSIVTDHSNKLVLELPGRTSPGKVVKIIDFGII